jgi:hypothetical protein
MKYKKRDCFIIFSALHYRIILTEQLCPIEDQQFLHVASENQEMLLNFLTLSLKLEFHH